MLLPPVLSPSIPSPTFPPQHTLRRLRNLLRCVVDELRKNRRLVAFDKPVDPEEVPDYYTLIAYPMDFCSMLDKIDSQQYMWCVPTPLSARTHVCHCVCD